MIAAERDRIFNLPVLSYATIVKTTTKNLFYIDNTLAYNQVKKPYVMH